MELLLKEVNRKKAPRNIIVKDKETTEICLMDFEISTAQQKDLPDGLRNLNSTAKGQVGPQK